MRLIDADELEKKWTIASPEPLVRARFKSIPSQLERQHPTYEQLYPFRRGEVIYIHPKGRFVSVRTETAGGPVVENFRLCEVVM